MATYRAPSRTVLSLGRRSSCFFRVQRRACLTALVLLGAAPAALANETPPKVESKVDREGAARDFGEGQKAFLAKDFRRAAALFESAYQLAPHHASLWNAARAWQRADETAKAANCYLRYLQEAPAEARDRDNANAALNELGAKLGRLEVHAPGADQVKLDAAAIANEAVIYVIPGDHLFESTWKGKAARLVKTVAAGETLSVSLVAPPSEAEPPLADPPPTAPPADTSRSGLSPVFVYVGAGVTAALGGVTLWSGFDTLSQRRKFDDDPSETNLDDGRSKQLRTNVLIGATAGAAMITGALAIFLVDWSGRPSPSSWWKGVSVGTGFAGTSGGDVDVTLRGAF